MKLFKLPEWRRPHWVMALLIALSTLLPAHAAVQELDHIVAVVNDQVITRQELAKPLRGSRANRCRSRIRHCRRARLLEKQLLERMITELALQQHAIATGIRVDPTQVERALQRIAAQNKLDMAGLQAALEKDGQSLDSMRNTIRNELLIARARERDVDNRISVSDAEIEGYLQTQAQQGVETEYNFAHILVTVPENASPEQIQARRARAEDILAQLNKGADFAQLSASYSDAPNALQGGVIGWRASGKIPTLFSDALKQLQPGQVSPILKSGNGFHILKLIDKRGLDATLNVTQTHARHILIKTNELTSETDARNRLLQLKERIENGAKFEDMARLQSEDASASKGGDLGWINPGDTVPEFEKAMNALKPGEISDPVQTPFGWHLIQVLARRTAGRHAGTPEAAGAPGHPRTQGRRSLPGLGAPDPRCGLCRNPPDRLSPDTPGVREAVNLPLIALTAGEPAGIGPDLCVALSQQALPCRLVGPRRYPCLARPRSPARHRRRLHHRRRRARTSGRRAARAAYSGCRSRHRRRARHRQQRPRARPARRRDRGLHERGVPRHRHRARAQGRHQRCRDSPSPAIPNTWPTTAARNRS